jgi:glycosyltransferase involved in cell wall biosynthesis
MQEIGGEAALYFDPNDPADMADKLMLIYKDESLRSRLISRGASVVSQYTWDRTAEAVWEAMMRALKGSHAPNP